MNDKTIYVRKSLSHENKVPIGLTNGYVKEEINRQRANEHGHSGGLINGNGMDDKVGFLGGEKTSGFVNGYRKKGMENYDIVEIRNSKYYNKRYGRRKLIETMTVMAIAVVLVSIPFMASYSIHYIEKIKVDGQFGDWYEAGIAMLTDSKYYKSDDENNHIKIEKYGATIDHDKIFVYLQNNENMMTGRQNFTDQTHIFVDTDNNKNTGYSIRSIGADLRVQVDGIWGGIHSNSVNTYGGMTGRDWVWSSGGNILSAMKGDAMEIAINKAFLGKNVQSYRLAIANIDKDGNMALSSAFDTDGNKINTFPPIFANGGEEYGNITIDGQFDDWVCVEECNHTEHCSNEEIRTNIEQTKKVSASEAISIYVQTNGTAFAGEIPSEQNNETNVTHTPNYYWNDTTNNSISVPFEENELNASREGNDTAIFKFGRNHRVLMRGIFEEIYQSDLQQLIGGQWIKIGNVNSSSNGSEMEMQLTDTGNFTVTNFTYDYMSVFVTDWKGKYDFVESTMLVIGKNSVKISSAGGSNEGIDAITVDTTSYADATKFSSQRKCFRDKFNYYWAIFEDSDNDLILTVSDDTTGSGYSTTYTIATAIADNAGSLWYDGDVTCYIVWVESYDIKIVKVTIASHSATVGTTYVALDGSGSGVYFVYPYVSISSGGYIWVTASHLHTTIKVNAARSSAVNNPSSFDSETEISNAGSTYLYPTSILPLSSNDMYAIYQLGQDASSSKFYGTLYTGGAWSGTYTEIGSGTADYTYEGFSDVVMTNGNIVVAYINSANKLVSNYRTTTWQGEGEIDATTTCQDCTITRDADGYLYLYYRTGNTAILLRTSSNGGVSWSASSNWQTGLSTVRFINSAYQTASTKIMVVWTGSNTNTYADYNNTIPDLSTLIKVALPPVLIGVVLVGRVISRKKVN